jgi:hypothetical protein
MSFYMVVHQASIEAQALSWSRLSSAQVEAWVNAQRLPIGSTARSSWKEDAAGGSAPFSQLARVS